MKKILINIGRMDCGHPVFLRKIVSYATLDLRLKTHRQRVTAGSRPLGV